MATPTIEINLKEVEALVKKIASYGEEMQRWVADEVAYTALMIESDAKKAAPVRTGRLRASITSIIDKESLSAVVGTAVEYAPIVEYGSKALNRRAKPYLYPAYLKHASEFVNRLRDAIR